MTETFVEVTPRKFLLQRPDFHGLFCITVSPTCMIVIYWHQLWELLVFYI